MIFATTPNKPTESDVICAFAWFEWTQQQRIQLGQTLTWYLNCRFPPSSRNFCATAAVRAPPALSPVAKVIFNIIPEGNPHEKRKNVQDWPGQMLLWGTQNMGFSLSFFVQSNQNSRFVQTFVSLQITSKYFMFSL